MCHLVLEFRIERGLPHSSNQKQSYIVILISCSVRNCLTVKLQTYSSLVVSGLKSAVCFHAEHERTLATYMRFPKKKEQDKARQEVVDDLYVARKKFHQVCCLSNFK